MKKSAVGLLEFLIIIIIIIIIFGCMFFMKSSPNTPNLFDFKESSNAVKQKEKLNEQINDIEKIRNQTQQIEKDMLEQQ